MTPEQLPSSAMHGVDSVIGKISECQTSYDVLRLTREIATDYGFQYFSICRLPLGDENSLGNVTVVSNWPAELISTYDQLGLLETSPVLSGLRKSTKPLIWKLPAGARDDPDERDTIIKGLFSKFDMRLGVYFPTQCPTGARGAVSFTGSRDEPSEKEMLELAYISNLIYEKATGLRAVPHTAMPTLTARERECLFWTANGKTSGEIATILTLSEHTVNHYLGQACQKLGAANRTHAVAKAIRSNILD